MQIGKKKIFSKSPLILKFFQLDKHPTIQHNEYKTIQLMKAEKIIRNNRKAEI